MDSLGRFVPAVVLGMGAFMATFDITAVSLALPAIGASLSLGAGDQIWIMSIYSMAFTVALIAAGTLADRYGAKLALLLGTLVFLISSAACGLAGSFELMISGRLVQGIGAAFVICGGYALMSRLYAEKAERVRAFAIMGTISGSAMAVGPGLGGVIANTIGWQWVFLINIPICVLILAALWGVTSDKLSSVDASIDIPGIAVFGALMLVASWCMIYGPMIGGVLVGPVKAAILISALAATLVWIESKAARPAVDLALFKRRAFVGLSIVPVCLAISYWSPLVFLPLMLGSVFRLENPTVSYVMLAFTAPMFLVPNMVAKLATRSKDRVFFSSGLLVVAGGCVLISLGVHLRMFALSLFGMVVAGSGAAAMQTQVSGALMAAAPNDRSGAVSAIMTILRQGGFVFGTAALTAVVRISHGRFESEFTILFLVCGAISLVGALVTRVLVLQDDDLERTGAYAR
jgi:MFS family permease